MKLRSVLLLLWLIAPFTLSAAEYQCRTCRIPILATDEFCPKCGAEAEKCRVLLYGLEADKVQQPLPQNHGYSRTMPVAQNSYTMLERRTHWTPVKIGLGGAASIPSISFSDCVEVYGLSVEFISYSDTAYGLHLGWCGGCSKLYGLRCSVIGNIAGYSYDGNAVSYGVQLAGIFNMSPRSSRGVYGIQLAGIFNESHNMHGIQIGFWNGENHDMYGIQIGVINKAKNMTGVQVGLLNFINDSPVPFFPVINGHF